MLEDFVWKIIDNIFIWLFDWDRKKFILIYELGYFYKNYIGFMVCNNFFCLNIIVNVNFIKVL